MEFCWTCQGGFWSVKFNKWIRHRQTAGLVCEECGWDYKQGEKPNNIFIYCKCGHKVHNHTRLGCNGVTVGILSISNLEYCACLKVEFPLIGEPEFKDWLALEFERGTETTT